MTIRAHDETGSFRSQWSTLAFFGLGAGLLNTIVVIIALCIIAQLDHLGDRIGSLLLLLLETAPVAFFTLWPVVRVMNSQGKLRGLLPAAVGSFLANTSGLLVVAAGIAYALDMLVYI